MDEQELLAMAFNYLHSGLFGKQTDLDKLYKLEDSKIETKSYNKFKKITNILFSMFEAKSKMKFKKSFFLYMFAVINELDDDGYELKSDETMNFFNSMADEWAILDNDSETQYLVESREQEYTWKNLMGFVDLEKEQKLSVLLNIVYSKLSNTFKEKSQKERKINTSTSGKVRFDLAIRDKNMVRVNGMVNGVWYDTSDRTEYQEFRLHEIIKSSNVHVDHISALHGPNDGTDSFDNLELTTAGYNLWKSNKV